MTVKELKEYLADKDDNQEVRIYDYFRECWEPLLEPYITVE